MSARNGNTQETKNVSSEYGSRNQVVDDVKKEVDMRIIELRNRKKEAIRVLDYQLAEEINNQISELHKEYELFSEDQQQMNFRIKLRQIIEDFKAHFITAKNEIHTEEMFVRNKINENFEKLRKKHVQELINLEKEYSAARLRESERIIPDYELLISESRYAAGSGNFEEARALQARADLLQQQDLAKRLGKTDEAFQENTKIQIQTQKREIEDLVAKYKDEMDTINKKAQNKLAKIRDNRENAIVAHMQMTCSKTKTSKPFHVITIEECNNNRIPIPRGITMTSELTHAVKNNNARTKPFARY